MLAHCDHYALKTLYRPYTILGKGLFGTARSSLFLSVYCASAWLVIISFVVSFFSQLMQEDVTNLGALFLPSVSWLGEELMGHCYFYY